MGKRTHGKARECTNKREGRDEQIGAEERERKKRERACAYEHVNGWVKAAMS